jgi:hypothetical protein
MSVSFHVDAVDKLDEEQEINQSDVDAVAQDVDAINISAGHQKDLSAVPALRHTDESADQSAETCDARCNDSGIAKQASKEKHERVAKRFSNLFNRH